MYIFLRILLCSMCALEIVAVNRPPLINTQTDDKEIVFIPGQSIQLLCRAEGNPEPNYSWKLNGLDYAVNAQNGRVMQLPGQGTLVFNSTKVDDEGFFQCFADNGYGVSVSNKIHLRAAKLGQFPNEPKWTHRVEAGYYLTLRCIPPMSYPYGDITWAVRDSKGLLQPVHLDDRVNVDLEGNLRFANIIKSDERSGDSYVCIVTNRLLRSISTGPEHVIQVEGYYRQQTPIQPLFTSPADNVFLKGEVLELNCLFAGHPTPEIHWSKQDADLSENAEITHGRLTIKDVQFSDAGFYQCMTSVPDVGLAIDRFYVRIESAPFWVDKPVSVEAQVNESATFTCLAAGVPEPKYTWYINGVPLDDSVRDPRIYQNKRFLRTNESSITLTNLSHEDYMNIQCNASNPHGYVFADVFLNVPSMEVDPEETGEDVILERLRLLEERLQDQERLIVLQQNQIRQLEAARENQTVCDQCASTSSSDNTMDSRIDSSTTERVAFSAYLDHPIQRLGLGHPIVYNMVIHNDGTAYDKHNGIFTCPMDGVYVVYFSVYTFGNDQVVAQLFMDGTGQVDAIADTVHRYHEAQGSNLVVTDLKQGQQVWVSNYRNINQTDNDFITRRYATFSAFRLYP